MKILRVITSMDPSKGGPSQGIRNLVPALEKIGIINEVVCFDNPNEQFLCQQSFLIHALGAGNGLWNYNAKLSRWLKYNLNRFDIVVIHGLWLYNSFGTYKSWKKFKKLNERAPSLFVMPHGMLDPYFQKAKDRKIKAIRNLFFWEIIEKKVVNNADGVLFTCKEEMSLARKTFKSYNPKSEIDIGYGIQPPPPYHESSSKTIINSIEISEPYLLFFGRIHPKKGLDILIKGYIATKAEGIHLPTLLIAGPGMETEFGKKILGLAGDKNNIIFVGMVSGESKWKVLQNCEAFILPSHQENFGIAVVEAMSCGKPVLISRQVNIYREIEIAEAGFITDDNEIGVKKLLINWANLSKINRSIMNKNAKYLFENYFSADKIAIRTKALLEKTVKS
jgi:glycosyltransferase involved in cell wall biosynthesis